MNEGILLAFKTQKEWGKWLTKNHQSANGIWLKFFKKASGIPTVSYLEAVEEALCFGWIDGKLKSLDEISYIQYFTPRRSKSVWSKTNTERVEKLIKLRKMKQSGLLEVEKAKADGRWQKAYESPKIMVMPEVFLREISKNKKAKAFYETLNKSNKYAIAWTLKDAKKEETRVRRIKKIIDMLSKGKKLY